MIYVEKLVREAISFYLHGPNKQGINVKTGHFEVISRKKKKCKAGKVNFGRADDLSLIMNHAILENYFI